MKNMWQKSAIASTAIASIATVFALSTIAFGGNFDFKLIDPDLAEVDQIQVKEIPEQQPLEAARVTPTFTTVKVDENVYVGDTLFTNRVQANIGEDESGVLELDANEVVVDDLTVTGNLDLGIVRVTNRFSSNTAGAQTASIACPNGKKVLSCGNVFEQNGSKALGVGIMSGNLFNNVEICTLTYDTTAAFNVGGTIQATCY